jgi:hypothetical protein
MPTAVEFSAAGHSARHQLLAFHLGGCHVSPGNLHGVIALHSESAPRDPLSNQGTEKRRWAAVVLSGGSKLPPGSLLRHFGPHPTLELNIYAARAPGHRSIPSHTLKFTDAFVSLYPAVHRMRAGPAHEALEVKFSFAKIDFVFQGGRISYNDSWLA